MKPNTLIAQKLAEFDGGEKSAEATTPKMKRQRWVYEKKQAIWMFLHGIFWKVLWLIHLARPYSRLACRLNIYSKYRLSGRCQWCGEKHGIHWKIEQPNYGGLTEITKTVNQKEGYENN